jgi:hypothetical protein
MFARLGKTILVSLLLNITDVIRIDLGIMILMAENQGSAFAWVTFMKNPEALSAVTAVGFH